jgi:hypothetical protein
MLAGFAPATIQCMKASTKKRVGLPTWEVLKLAGEARLDARTVNAVLEGASTPNRRQQVIDAAARLGMALDLGPRARAT